MQARWRRDLRRSGAWRQRQGVFFAPLAPIPNHRERHRARPVRKMQSRPQTVHQQMNATEGLGVIRTKARSLHVEMRVFWTLSKTTETDPGMYRQSFKNPKYLLCYLLCSLPPEGLTQRPSLTGQRYKLRSAVRWYQEYKPSMVYPQLNVFIERPSFVLTPPPRSSLRPQDSSWRRQTVKRPVPQCQREAVTCWTRARLQALLPLQRLFPSTPTGSAAVDRP
jgi:hypothetical protein